MVLVITTILDYQALGFTRVRRIQTESGLKNEVGCLVLLVDAVQPNLRTV